MMQLLSQHRYEHINSGERLEERLQLARDEEMFWRGIRDRIDEYRRFMEMHGKDMLLLLETTEAPRA